MGEHLVPVSEGQLALDSQERLLRADVSSMSMYEVFVAWSVLDHAEKVSAKRKKVLRERLLTDATALGELGPKGARVVTALGGSFTSQRREVMKLNCNKVQVLLRSRDIEFVDAGTFKFEPSESKLEDLLLAGRLSPEEISSCYDAKIVYALVVKKPHEVQKMIDGGSSGRIAGDGIS